MLVSCLMPTRGRPALARQALACWLAQTYPWRELVIVDDRDDPSFPDGLHLDGVQYHMLERRLSVGAKRNIACSRAQGQIFCHFDDDDWSAPERIESQLRMLIGAGMSVAGYRSMRFTDGSRWWLYDSCNPLYALGTSLMYRREWWQANPFADLKIGEDNQAVAAARRASQLVTEDAGDQMIATIHPANTSPRVFNAKQWKPIDRPSVVPEMWMQQSGFVLPKEQV
jgi:glycosyltransferase involved in cell wall biosynthesis